MELRWSSSATHRVLLQVEADHSTGEARRLIFHHHCTSSPTQQLPRGLHQYKFIVDGEWRFSPEDPSIPDANGNINNYIDTTNFHPMIDTFKKYSLPHLARRRRTPSRKTSQIRRLISRGLRNSPRMRRNFHHTMNSAVIYGPTTTRIWASPTGTSRITVWRNKTGGFSSS